MGCERMKGGGRTETALDPGLARCDTAGLFDLEPLGFGGVEVVAELVTARSHVGHHWADVVGPLCEKSKQCADNSRERKCVRETHLRRAIRRRAYHQA